MDLLGSLTETLRQLAAAVVFTATLLIGAAAGGFSYFTHSPGAPAPLPAQPIATSTPVSATSTPLHTAPATTTPKTAAKKPGQPVSVPAATVPAVSTPQAPLISGDQVNTLARASIVNILCLTSADLGARSISGSGVIIDARGVILTNAHIGQYFLLEQALGQSAVDCTIRTGSPASAAYRASLLYLPPQWIDANATQITAEHAVGTGEYDYAFLYINASTNPSASLPSSFTNIAMSALMPIPGDSVLVAGYPAGFLDSLTIERNLYATSAFTEIGQLYTFDDPTHVDVVSLGGTVVSQGGSSGGAVVRSYDGKLTALISNETTGTTTASRDLRAITISYINRSLAAEGKGGLAEFLSTDLAGAAAAFAAAAAPGEAQQLISAIEK